MRLTNAADGVVAGTVKWFDRARGFGFVTCDGVTDDVLLHINVLRNRGVSALAEGTRLQLRLTHGQRGLQASEVTQIDMGLVSDDPAGSPGAPEAAAPSEPSVPVPARIKWFDAQKGFGFASVFGQDGDVYLHADVLRRSGLGTVEPGEAVCLRVGDGARGRVAIELLPWGAACCVG